MTAEPAVRGVASSAPATLTGTQTMTLPSGIQTGDTIVIAVAGANTLNVHPVRLTVGSTAYTEVTSSRRSGGSNLLAWVVGATSSMSGATVTLVKDPAVDNFRVAMAAAVLANVSPAITVQSSTFITVVNTKTTPTVAVPAKSQIEVSIVGDDDTTTPGTSTWTAPSGITKVVQAAHVSSGGPPRNAVAIGIGTARVFGGDVGGRVWTSDQTNGGCAMTLALAAPVVPARHVRHPEGAWHLIEQAGT